MNIEDLDKADLYELGLIIDRVGNCVRACEGIEDPRKTIPLMIEACKHIEAFHKGVFPNSLAIAKPGKDVVINHTDLNSAANLAERAMKLVKGR